MGAYFKPLRRKLGAVTLLMACVFTAGWVRSHVVADELTFRSGGATAERILLLHAKLSWLHYSEGIYELDFGLSTFWNTLSWRVYSVGEMADFDEMAVQWRFRIMGAGAGVIPADAHSFGGYDTPFWYLSCWAITIPLTLLSARLLLGKPRETAVQHTAKRA